MLAAYITNSCFRACRTVEHQITFRRVISEKWIMFWKNIMFLWNSVSMPLSILGLCTQRARGNHNHIFSQHESEHSISSVLRKVLSLGLRQLCLSSSKKKIRFRIMALFTIIHFKNWCLLKQSSLVHTQLIIFFYFLASWRMQFVNLLNDEDS